MLPTLLVLLAAAATPSHGGLVPRTGFVTLQFDDTHDYCYTRIFPRLQERGLKASFGYITEVSDLGMNNEPWKMQQIYQAGHEVQDHTTRHDYQWATAVDTLDDGVDQWVPYTFADVARWDSLCGRSRDYLDALGIRVYGWNQPGGSGGPGSIPGHPQWTWMGGVHDSLYQLIGRSFGYAVAGGVDAATAHLNLRGHNFPDRFPFFNVPPVTVDNKTLQEAKTGIADAVASGLWYLAVSHASNLDQVTKAESLIDWLAASQIEVLTCRAGVERLQCGVADRFANQLPQASMACDIDANGRPDGFAGDCAWDTLSVPPLSGLRCLVISGTAEFCCNGPEVGRNAFSVWLKSATGSPSAVSLIYAQLDFDQQLLDETWTTLPCSAQWARMDTLQNPGLLIEVAENVDRIRFLIAANAGQPVLVAGPDLVRVPEATSGVDSPHNGPQPGPGLAVSPNPVRVGGRLHIESGDRQVSIGLYDVAGRCLLIIGPPAGRTGIDIDTGRLAPGVIFLRDLSAPRLQARVVVLK